VFNANVIAERGNITVRPAPGWILPPVLTSEEFAEIETALSASNRAGDIAWLTDASRPTHYIRTTQGLVIENGRYVPDTGTKYVLNFTGSLNDPGLIGLFEAAGYLTHTIEVVNTNLVQITGSTVNIRLPSRSTGVRHADYDWMLADGRRWRIDIGEGAFRDAAGNPSAAWSGEFWSQRTAAPVIRVDRVSNNRAINTGAGTLQTSVRFRIDTETPGAAIQYGQRNVFTDEVSTSTTAGAHGGISVDGPQNSGYSGGTVINDATETDLNTTNLPATASYNYTGGNFPTIGNIGIHTYTQTEFYTARKDYIAATATRAGVLSPSLRSYEGAFKTVIVYRNPPVANGTDRFVRTEAVDMQNGTVRTAGFPMSYNDMSGAGARFAYQISSHPGELRQNPPLAADWVFITWEIVTNFWHVGMITGSPDPNSPIHGSGVGDAWQPFSGDWFNHNFRKYGNWGLRIGN
jgi:hypothetical protein